MLLSIAVISLLGLGILGISSVYADDDQKSYQLHKTTMSEYIQSYSNGTAVSYFKENAFRIEHDPKVCAVEDQSNSQFNVNLAKNTLYATIDWSTKLNAGIGKSQVWHIGYRTLSYDSFVKFDPQCDILVRFFSKTFSDDPYFVGISSGGVTYYDYSQHKAFIKILYDGLTDPQIRGVIEHELGHALGLGHYITSETQLERIGSGLEDSPSIMVGVVPQNNYFSITPIDVQQIKNKYGNYGFGGKPADFHSATSGDQTGRQATSLAVMDHDLFRNSMENNTSRFLPQMIRDDVSDGISFIGTGSVLVKDLVASGYLTIPVSANKQQLTYELPLSFRYHFVNEWAKGNMTDDEFIKSFQSLINSGKLNLTTHFKAYED